MSETLASRRSPGRSRGLKRAGACSVSDTGALVGPPAAGGGLPEPRVGGGGFERRLRLRVIGENAQ